MKTRESVLVTAFLAAFACGATLPVAFADDPEKKDEKKDEKKGEKKGGESAGGDVITTKFVEAFQVGEYAAAVGHFEDLGRGKYLSANDPVLKFKYAVALYNVGKKEDSKRALEGIIEQSSDHIMALYYLAVVEAESATPQNKQPLERAKDSLIHAGKNGFYVLREVRNAKSAPVKALQDDPKFILQAMRATARDLPQLQPKNMRNPFMVPKIDPKRGTLEQSQLILSEQDIERLGQEIQNLFTEIEQYYAAKDFEKLQPLFQKLAELMAKYRKIGIERIQANLKNWDRRFDDLKEIRLTIQLNIFLHKGNECLRAMARAKQAEKFDEVLEQFNEVKVIVEQMRAEKRDDFDRNADALLQRATELRDKALKLKKIKEFQLIVTGIVVDSRPESKNRAIIVFGDPSGKRGGPPYYEENDTIRDKDDKKVVGLKVEKIMVGSVKFKFEDTEFVRELKTPQ